MEPTQHAETPVTQDFSHPDSPQEYLRIFLSGFAMGASDIVPGVSGGTMAFILGIYETLINGIKSFNLDALKKVWALLTGSEKNTTLSELITHLHLRFLIPLVLGIGVAVLLLTGLLDHWLATYPTYVFAFFAGLIIASIIAIGYKVKWGIVPLVTLIIGILVAYLATDPSLSVGENFGHSLPVLFFSGMIAICAMILPGVSGSFLLLVLGQYDFIISAVKNFDIMSILAVGCGVIVGILSFSRILSWLLEKYEHPTVALLVGFMIGAMRLIIFRITHFVDKDTRIATPVDIDMTMMVIAVALGLMGFIAVTVLDHMQSRSNPILALVDRNN